MLELVVFLLANILVALGCLVVLRVSTLEHCGETYLYAAAALVPVLMLLLHPKVFYTAADAST